MGNARSESSPGILTGNMRGRTSGSIYGRERTGQKMDRKKQTQPQARRDGDGTVRGSVHGSQGSAEGASSETSGTAATSSDTTEQVQTETRWMGATKVVDDRISSALPVPRVSSFVPQPCSCCTALRPVDTNYSRVVSTQGRIRYCKCSFCGNTWKDQG